MEVKIGFKWLFWAVLTIVGFHVGYTMAYTNQTANCLNAKFKWDDDQKTMYQSMLGSFAVGAMMIGSLFGGRLIAFGRHRVLIIAAFIGIIGVGITLI